MHIAKKSIGIILLSVPFGLIAQEKPEKQSITKIGINYSADYTYRQVIMDSYYHTSPIWLTEAAVYGFHTGLDFYHQFRFGLILEGGLQYSRFGGKIKNLAYINSNGDEDGKVNVTNYYDYLAVPVKIGYGFPIGKRIILSATTGVSLNSFLARNTRSDVTYDDGSTAKFKNTDKTNDVYGNKMKQFSLVSISSIGIDIQVFDTFSIRFEPTFRFFPVSTSSTQMVTRPFSFGMNTTLFYKFNHT